MAWKFVDVDTNDIVLSERPKSAYAEIYDKIFQLKIGKRFKIETENSRQAANIRNSVSEMLRRKGVKDKYIASNRLNVFYCGRVK